jgi:hypothetical protein
MAGTILRQQLWPFRSTNTEPLKIFPRPCDMFPATAKENKGAARLQPFNLVQRVQTQTTTDPLFGDDRASWMRHRRKGSQLQELVERFVERRTDAHATRVILWNSTNLVLSESADLLIGSNQLSLTLAGTAAQLCKTTPSTTAPSRRIHPTQAI